jgi:hypothetical protein
VPGDGAEVFRDTNAAGDHVWLMPLWPRRVLLLAPPLMFAGLAVAHPQPEPNLESLMDAATWFAVFHVIQLVLTGLVAVSVLLLADNFGRATAWMTRVGVGVFLVFFSAYDTLAGIGTGLAMRSARDLPLAQQEGVFSVVKDWPALSAPFALSIVGTLGWVVAVGSVSLAARRQKARRLEWVLLMASSLFLLVGHPFPGGTLAFGSLFLAAVIHEFGSGRPVGRRSAAGSVTEHDLASTKSDEGSRDTKGQHR